MPKLHHRKNKKPGNVITLDLLNKLSKALRKKRVPVIKVKCKLNFVPKLVIAEFYKQPEFTKGVMLYFETYGIHKFTVKRKSIYYFRAVQLIEPNARQTKV